MGNKVLTISIAAYNMEKYISQTIESLLAPGIIDQLEILVNDDGGTDSTLEIARNYAEQYPASILPVHKEDAGWGSTVNYAIQHATGKYLILLDGDDYFSTDSLVKLVKFLEEHDSDAISAPYFKFTDGEVGHTMIPLDTSIEVHREYSVAEVHPILHYYIHSLFFKTSMLQQHGISVLENCYYTDCEYVSKALSCCKTVSFFEHPLYNYRVGRNGQSISKSGYRKHFREHENVILSLMEYRESAPSGRNQAVVTDMINRLTGKQYLIYTFLEKKEHPKQKFWEFNDWMKKNGFYESCQLGHAMSLFRKLPFAGFELAKVYYSVFRVRE